MIDCTNPPDTVTFVGYGNDSKLVLTYSRGLRGPRQEIFPSGSAEYRKWRGYGMIILEVEARKNPDYHAYI